MKTRTSCLILSFVLCGVICFTAPAQTTIDQRLLTIQNDGLNGGVFMIAVQAKGTNLPANKTIGTATIDIQFDAAKLTFNNVYSFPGITIANGYSRFVSQDGNVLRVGILPTNVNGIDALGTDLTTSYVTWATISFTIMNFASTSTMSILPATNQIALFAQEGNSNGAGGAGNGILNNQTLSTPIIITDVPLPVELVSFTATPEQHGTRLCWKTATETNNAGFEIERADASCAQQSRVWTTVGYVAGNGSTGAEKNYSFLAANVSPGKSVYRLRQIDRDGSARYSPEVEVGAVVPKAFALLQNYPNPFNPSTTFAYSVPEDSHVSIVVYDVLGRIAAVLVDDAKPAGYYSFTYNAAVLSSGVYIYRMDAHSAHTTYTETKRFTLLR